MKNERLGWYAAGIAVAAILAYIILRKFKRKNAMCNLPNVDPYLLGEMWDERVSKSRIESMHPCARDNARAVVNMLDKSYGVKIRVTEGYRSPQRQQMLYDRQDGTTNAQAYQSYHNYGLAFDVVIMENGRPIWDDPDGYETVHAVGRELGFEPISSPTGWDRYHLQVPDYEWRDLKAIVDRGDTMDDIYPEIA